MIILNCHELLNLPSKKPTSNSFDFFKNLYMKIHNTDQLKNAVLTTVNHVEILVTQSSVDPLKDTNGIIER